MTAYAPDTIYQAIEVTTANNVFRVIEDNGGVNQSTLDVTLDVGTYFLHSDNGFHLTLKGLLWAIEKILTDGTTVGLGTLTVTGAAQNNPTYDFEVADPTSSTGLVNNGLALRAVAFVEEFDVMFSDAAFTMSPRWFGVASDAPGFDVSSSLDAADHVATMPAGTRFRKVTRDLGAGQAIDKRRFNYKDVNYSSSRPSESVAVVWDQGYFRRFVYQDVLAADVFQDRGSETEWAAQQSRLVGDTHATWYDVWDALSDAEELIIVHNDSGSDLQIDSHSYEVVKLWQKLDWQAFASQQSEGGDFYTIEFSTWVDTTRSDYDH